MDYLPAGAKTVAVAEKWLLWRGDHQGRFGLKMILLSRTYKLLVGTLIIAGGVMQHDLDLLKHVTLKNPTSFFTF